MKESLQDLESLSPAEHKALKTFIKTGTLNQTDLPGLSRAERRQFRKRCARLAQLAGHNMQWRKPGHTLNGRLAHESKPKSVFIWGLNAKRKALDGAALLLDPNPTVSPNATGEHRKALESLKVGRRRTR